MDASPADTCTVALVGQAAEHGRQLLAAANIELQRVSGTCMRVRSTLGTSSRSRSSESSARIDGVPVPSWTLGLPHMGACSARERQEYTQEIRRRTRDTLQTG